MLGWIERVVPQPPVCSPTPVVMEKAAKPEPKAKGAKPGKAGQKPLEGNSSCPAGGSEKKDVIVTSDPPSITGSSGRSVLTWLSQGMGKVMPQPLQNPSMPQQNTKRTDASAQVKRVDLTEIQNLEDEGSPVPETAATDPSGGEGEPQSSADNNALEKNGGKKVFTRLFEEFGKMIPQPENAKKTEEGTPEDHTVQGNTKGSNKEMPRKESSPAKPPGTNGTKHRASADSQSGMNISLFPETLGGDRGSVFKRFVHGLEKAIPQPVSKEKQDGQTEATGGLGSGQERNKGA